MSSQGKANPNGNLFEIKTVQSGAFRTLIEALKEFEKTGIVGNEE